MKRFTHAIECPPYEQRLTKKGKEERAHATGEGSARHLQGGGLGSGIPGGFRKTQEASPLMLLASLLLLEGLSRQRSDSHGIVDDVIDSCGDPASTGSHFIPITCSFRTRPGAS